MLIEAGVLIGARAAQLVAPLLADAVRRGQVRDPEVLGVVEELARLARAARAAEPSEPLRNRSGAFPVPLLASGVSIAQAARVLGISARAVRKRCETGALPAVKVAGQWRVLDEEVARGARD